MDAQGSARSEASTLTTRALQAKDEELAKLRASIDDGRTTITTKLEEERSIITSSKVPAAVSELDAAAQHAYAKTKELNNIYKTKELETELARVQASLEACQTREAQIKHEAGDLQQLLEEARVREMRLEQRLADVEDKLAASQIQAAEAADGCSAAALQALESRMQEVRLNLAAAEALTAGESLVESVWGILEAARARAEANVASHAARADACQALSALSAAHAGDRRILDACAVAARKEFFL